MTTTGQPEFTALGFDPAPGDLSRVDASAEQYHLVARKLSSALDAINAIVNQTGIWEGQASEAFARRVDNLPDYLDRASQSMSRASTALADWSESLGVMQRNAVELEQRAHQARQNVARRGRRCDAHREQHPVRGAASGCGGVGVTPCWFSSCCWPWPASLPPWRSS